MSRRADRKLVEMRLKFDGLNIELVRWMELSRAGGPLEKHHSQIRAVIGTLNVPLAELRAAIGDDPFKVLTSWPVFEARLLRLHDIWDYFRQKFALRMTDVFAPYLTVADEFAWACYNGVRERAGMRADQLREAPLTFLGAADTPYALSRGAPFADEVPSGKASDFAAVLAAMPIPIIGLPWFQLRHLPECLLVGHEVGHHIETDLELSATLSALLDVALLARASPSERSRWQNWLGEVFADIFGTLAGGLAYGYVLADFGTTEQSVHPSSQYYPPIGVRVHVVAATLRESGLDADANALLDRWQAETSVPAKPVEPVAGIVGHLLSGPYPQFDHASLTDVLNFAAHQAPASMVSTALLRGFHLPEHADVRTVLAGAGLAFATDPELYAGSGVTDAVLRHVRASLDSGIRSETATRSSAQRDRTAGQRIADLLWGSDQMPLT